MANRNKWSVERRRARVWILALGLAAARVSLTAQVPADEPVERTDHNSQVAHQDLLKKKTQGTIDVYFEGDSILRRWGATDYPELLANWQKTFHGWNAADFAWGGDTTQNILWRLGAGGDDGELDGVNPSVIVLQAGTNNIGGRVPPGGQAGAEAKAEDVTRGLIRIVEVMREKAPGAAIIVTGIFPRNDNLRVMPIIHQINNNLKQWIAEQQSAGVRIQYLNINGQLAGADDRLYPGMMNARDKLHPELAGYQVWGDALVPLLTELLGPPASEDHAPPPTGNPAAEGR